MGPATTAGKYPRENNVYVCVYTYILGVARYTDVTVRYVPRFGGHGLIRFRYNRKKKQIYYAQSLFIYFEQTVVQITFFSHLDVKILNIIMLYIKSVLFSL